MPPTTAVPPSLPFLLERIEYWKQEELISDDYRYQVTCEAIIKELKLVVKYLKG